MSDLLVQTEGATTLITLNRPDQRNAMTAAMRDELIEVVAAFNADPSQRVAIVTGAGTSAFSAGADLKEMASTPTGGRVPMSRQPEIGGVASSQKPVIAAINGLAVAGGLELAISCDIRIAVPDAWFGLSEVQRGLVAGVAVTVLPRLVPYGVAADLVLAGTRLTAERALSVGLVQDVVEPERLLEAAFERAERIAQSSPTAVWASKQVMSYWRNLQVAEHQRFYEAVVHRALLTGDYREGPAAFAEKRIPNFADDWPTPGAS